MSNVLMQLPGSARGLMATKLLEAAEELGLEPGVIQSQSEGFLVPEEVHKHLFPSSYTEEDDDPGKDFADLTPEEQEALTNPDAKD